MPLSQNKAEENVFNAAQDFCQNPPAYPPPEHSTLESCGIGSSNIEPFTAALRSSIAAEGYSPPEYLNSVVQPTSTIEDIVKALTDSTGPR